LIWDEEWDLFSAYESRGICFQHMKAEVLLFTYWMLLYARSMWFWWLLWISRT
jgi:hypothetical protein